MQTYYEFCDICREQKGPDTIIRNIEVWVYLRTIIAGKNNHGKMNSFYKNKYQQSGVMIFTFLILQININV